MNKIDPAPEFGGQRSRGHLYQRLAALVITLYAADTTWLIVHYTFFAAKDPRHQQAIHGFVFGTFPFAAILGLAGVIVLGRTFHRWKWPLMTLWFVCGLLGTPYWLVSFVV